MALRVYINSLFCGVATYKRDGEMSEKLSSSICKDKL